MYKIVLDPGHGGHEAAGKSSPYGTRSASGAYYEKDLCLELTRRVADRLRGHAVLTRTSDVNVSLAERIQTARRFGARAFVSIHAGHGPREQRGPDVWVHPRANPASLRLAHRLAGTLASQEQLPRVLSGNLAVLSPERYGSGTAACLIEVDNLNNPEVEDWLRYGGGLDTLAERIASGLRQDVLAYGSVKGLDDVFTEVSALQYRCIVGEGARLGIKAKESLDGVLGIGQDLRELIEGVKDKKGGSTALGPIARFKEKLLLKVKDRLTELSGGTVEFVQSAFETIKGLFDQVIATIARELAKAMVPALLTIRDMVTTIYNAGRVIYDHLQLKTKVDRAVRPGIPLDAATALLALDRKSVALQVGEAALGLAKTVVTGLTSGAAEAVWGIVAAAGKVVAKVLHVGYQLWVAYQGNKLLALEHAPTASVVFNKSPMLALEYIGLADTSSLICFLGAGVNKDQVKTKLDTSAISSIKLKAAELKRNWFGMLKFTPGNEPSQLSDEIVQQLDENLSTIAELTTIEESSLKAGTAWQRIQIALRSWQHTHNFEQLQTGSSSDYDTGDEHESTTTKKPKKVERIPSTDSIYEGRAALVLDPGHGGHDVMGKSTPYGSPGPDGVPEKDFTLALSQRIIGRLGGHAVATRSGDYNVSLAERIQAARRCGARAFVSVHTNASPGTGSVVWVHPRANAESLQLARDLAAALEPGAPSVQQAELAVLSPERFGGTAACLVEVARSGGEFGALQREIDYLANRFMHGLTPYLSR